MAILTRSHRVLFRCYLHRRLSSLSEVVIMYTFTLNGQNGKTTVNRTKATDLPLHIGFRVFIYRGITCTLKSRLLSKLIPACLWRI